jgi:hypothetical protein
MKLFESNRKKLVEAMPNVDVIGQAGIGRKFDQGRKSIEDGFNTMIALSQSKEQKEKIAKDRQEALNNHYNNAIKIATEMLLKKGEM